MTQIVAPHALFGVGPARTGTRYLASFFAPPIRVAHEPEAAALIALLRGRHEGDLSEADFRAALRARAARLALDVDIAHVNYFLLDFLRDEFPACRFLLTWRDPRDWLESFVNHQLAHPQVGGHWRWLRDLRFRPARHPCTPHDAGLAARGLYSLDGYLSYYAGHLSAVRRMIAPSRLLALRTEALAEAAPAIAGFIGIDALLLRPSIAMRNAVAHATPLTDIVDARYLADRIAWHGDAARLDPEAWTAPPAPHANGAEA